MSGTLEFYILHFMSVKVMFIFKVDRKWRLEEH